MTSKIKMKFTSEDILQLTIKRISLMSDHDLNQLVRLIEVELQERNGNKNFEQYNDCMW